MESHPQLQWESGFALQRIHKHKEIPLAPGEREHSQGSLFTRSFFCALYFHILEKKPFLTLPGENTKCEVVVVFTFSLSRALSTALQP